MYVGIDVGKNGGICFLEDEKDYEVIPMPLYTKDNGKEWMDVFEVEKFITRDDRHKKIKLAYIEQQHVFPGQGSVSSASIMAQYHHLLGMFQIWKLNYQTPPATEWKKHFDLVGKTKIKSEKKKMAMKLARELGSWHFKKKESNRVSHDGMAEAYLIALYAKRTHEAL